MLCLSIWKLWNTLHIVLLRTSYDSTKITLKAPRGCEGLGVITKQNKHQSQYIDMKTNWQSFASSYFFPQNCLQLLLNVDEQQIEQFRCAPNLFHKTPKTPRLKLGFELFLISPKIDLIKSSVWLIDWFDQNSCYIYTQRIWDDGISGFFMIGPKIDLIKFSFRLINLIKTLDAESTHKGLEMMGFWGKLISGSSRICGVFACS